MRKDVLPRHTAIVGTTGGGKSTTVARLAEKEECFDAVLAMEVVEHVADVGLFIDQCASVLAPAGVMIVATINRTLKSSL